MSFAAEMQDFFSAFKGTSSAAGSIKDRIEKRKNTFDFDAAKKNAPGAGTFGPGAGGSKTSGKNSIAPPAEIKKVIEANVPEDMRDYAYRMAQKESAFNPSAVSKTGATGLFQFTSGTWTDMTKQSIGAHSDGRKDPVANTQAFVKLTERNKDYLTKVLGRDPTYGELAIAHQQGPAGAAYLITGRAPKGVNVAQIEKNLSYNNIKTKGLDAAKHIAGYYGFDLGDMSKVASGDMPDVPMASYTPPQVPGASNSVAGGESDGSYDDAGTSSDGSNQQADLLEGSRNAAIDVSAIDIPEGAKLYAPGDLTENRPIYAAGGMAVPTSFAKPLPFGYDKGSPVYAKPPNRFMPPRNPNPRPPRAIPLDAPYSAPTTTVPWAGEVSRVVRPVNDLPVWRPKQTTGAVADVPDVVEDKPPKPKPNNPLKPNKPTRPVGPENPNNNSGNKGNGGIGGGFGPNGAGNRGNGGYGNSVSQGGSPSRGLYAAGGPIENEPPEEAAVHQEEAPAPAQAVPTAPAPVTPAGNPAMGRANRDVLAMEQRQRPASGEGGLSIGNAIDLGLKHLTRALGLDQQNAAVGPDPEYRNKQRKLVNGAISPNEGPPNSQEVQQIFQTVDPNGELDDSLRTIYAMKKGVEFYLQRGDTDKAGKFAAGLIQYSNLLSRRYGYEAVQAGKNGDTDGMVKYAIKAYDAVPDGLSADVQATNGGYQVTRTNEDGQVVDQHMLSPQQIFQMATGISTGSGYFEALMDVAEPGTSASARKEKQAKARAGNLDKLLPDIKGDMDPGEIDAWSSAVEDGDYDTLNKIIGNVQTRRRENAKEEAQTKRDEIIDRRLEEARAATEANLDKRLEASEGRQQKAIDAADERATKRDEARDAADQKKRERRVNGKIKLRSDYEADMTASEKEQWDAAVEEVDPEALDDIMGNVDKRRENKRSDERVTNQNKAIDDRQTRSQEATDQRAEKNRTAQESRDLEKRKRRAGTLNELYDAYSPQMTAGQKRAWQKAFQDSDPETLQTIINSIDRSFGAPLPGEDDTGGDGAIPTTPQAPALTSSAEAAPVTSGSSSGNPLPADVLAKAKKAISEGRSRAGVIKKLQDAGYSTEGL